MRPKAASVVSSVQRKTSKSCGFAGSASGCLDELKQGRHVAYPVLVGAGKRTINRPRAMRERSKLHFVLARLQGYLAICGRLCEPIVCTNKRRMHIKCILLLLVRARGLEPPQPCDHKNLNLTRLPIPPYPHLFLAWLLNATDILYHFFGNCQYLFRYFFKKFLCGKNTGEARVRLAQGLYFKASRKTVPRRRTPSTILSSDIVE